MLSPLATPTVVSGAELLSSCQIPQDLLQRSWFRVTSAMSSLVKEGCALETLAAMMVIRKTYF